MANFVSPFEKWGRRRCCFWLSFVLTRQESLSNFPAQIFLSSYNFSVKVGLLTKIFVFVCTLEYLTVHKFDNWKKNQIFTSAAHTYLYFKFNPLISNFRFSSSKNSQERRLTMLRTAVTCLKVTFFQKVRFAFYPIPKNYPEVEIEIFCQLQYTVIGGKF